MVGLEGEEDAVEVGLEDLEFVEIVDHGEQTIGVLAVGLGAEDDIGLQEFEFVAGIMVDFRLVDEVDRGILSRVPLLSVSEEFVADHAFPF
jgi:hypothetical protein